MLVQRFGRNQTQAGTILQESGSSELAHSQFQRGQTIREPFLSASSEPLQGPIANITADNNFE